MTRWLNEATWAQRVGAAFGAVYVLVGAVGFVVTSGVGFAALRGKDLVLFEVNPLHNVIHLGIGGALLYAALNSASASRLMNRLIGGTYLAVAIAGLFIVEADTSLFRGLVEQRSSLNILALNHPDNLLHVASAIVLIGSTLIARRAVTRTEDAVATGEIAPVERAAPAGGVRGGDIVTRSGSYRCTCGRFAVAIRQGHTFPECPEPSGSDDDHAYVLQRRPAQAASSNGGAKRAAGGAKPTKARAKAGR